LNEKSYILTISDLQDMVYKKYSQYLGKHDGIRPNNPESTHTDINENQLNPYQDNWDLLENIFNSNI